MALHIIVDIWREFLPTSRAHMLSANVCSHSDVTKLDLIHKLDLINKPVLSIYKSIYLQ